MQAVPQASHQNTLEQAANTRGCRVCFGTNSLIFLVLGCRMRRGRAHGQRAPSGASPEEESSTFGKMRWAFKIRPSRFCCSSSCGNRYIRKGHFKTNIKKKKREVFYIQMNLYFCHKTFNSKEGIFNTELGQGSPRHTATITHVFTGHWSVLQSYNYFLWRFLPPSPLPLHFQEQLLHRSTVK